MTGGWYDKVMLEFARQCGLETGKPSGDLDNVKWQQCFKLMKLLNYETPLRKSIPRYFSECGSDCGYAQFMNGVLCNIREGERDYCTRIYQIADILKIEGNRLQAIYLPKEKLFEVWLEDN